MISYDNYKNRIEKLAKAKRILHKFRFVICGALALIVGTSVGLMVAKGSYTSGMSLSARSVMFNEDYDVTAAKAFLSSSSDQHIEYRGESGDWTKEKPVKAGKYSARTVTKKIVGYSYSPAVDFEITPIPAEFAIVGESVVYGDIPVYSMTRLVAGHSVDESALKFDYKEYGAAVTEVKVDAGSIKIIDEKGDDFSECYDWGEPEGKELTIRQRSITVMPASHEFTYDAQPHFADNSVSEETLESLVTGDTLTVTTALSNYAGVLEDGAVNAGGYTVSCESIAIMHGDTDISAWYNVARRTSQLTISRRKLTITTGDAQKEYDGKPAENKQLTCENLVEGHVAAVNASTLPKDTDVGTYDNVYDVTILDGTTDVSRNYEIDKDKSKFGKLTIKPRPIVIELSAIDNVTYGETFGYNDEEGNYANSPDLANGEKLKIAVVYKQNGLIVAPKNAGWYSAEIDLENCTFYKADGTEIDGGVNNYSIQCAPLENLAIRKFEFIVKPLDLTKENGTALKYGDKLNYPDYIGNYFGLSSKEAGAYDITELPYGEQIKILGFINYIKDNTAVAFPDKLNVGMHKIAAAGYIALFDRDGNAIQFDANYQCRGSEFADLEVVSREITVTVDGKTAAYGEALPENSFTVTQGAMQYGETLTFTTHLEKGGVICTPETWQGYTLLNVGTYSIVPNPDKNVTGGSLDNYDLTIVSGTLEITKRVIYYVTADDTKVYNGSYLQNTDYTTYLAADNTKAGLLNGDELSLRPDITRIIGAERRMNINYYDCPANYSINMEMSAANFGWLEVTPRPIEIKLSAIDYVFYGKTFEYRDEEGNYANSPDLANGEKLKIAVVYKQDGSVVTPKNVGEYSAELDVENCTLYNADGTEIEGGIKNYEITCAPLENLNIYWSVLTLTPLSFTRENGNAVMYGDEFVYPVRYGNYEACEGLQYGERLKIIRVNVYRFKDNPGWTTGWYPVYPVNAYESYKIVGEKLEYIVTDSEGNDTTDNYAYVHGSLKDSPVEVIPRPIMVKIDDKTATYGGALPENSFTVTEGAMQYSDKLLLTYKYDREVKGVGDYDILEDKVAVGEYDFVENKVVAVERGEENYDITFVKGTLTVTRAKLTVVFSNSERIYYGENWSYPTGAGNYKTRNDSVTGLANGEEIELAVDLYSRETGSNGENPLKVGRYSLFVNLTYSKIYSADGNEIIHGIGNYDLTASGGQLSVEPKPITVTIADNAVVYGESAEGKIFGYTVNEQLPYGDEITIESFIYKKDGAKVTPKDAGEYEVVGDEVLVNGSTDGASNYDITYKGTLTVDKLELNIRFKHAGYSATYGVHDYCYVASEMQSYFVTAEDGIQLELPYGQNLYVRWRIIGVDEDEIPAVKDGGYVLKADLFKIFVGNYFGRHDEVLDEGDGEHLKNYVITCADSHLSVTPRELTVNVTDVTIEYGSELPETFGYKLNESDALYQQLVIGESFEFEFGFEEEINGIGDYPFVIKSAKVYDKNGNEKIGGENNYKFVCNGTLTVTKKVIWFLIKSKECYYGDDLPQITYKITKSNGDDAEITLPNGDTFVPDEFFFSDFESGQRMTPKNVGVYLIELRDKKVMNGDTDVSNNYAIYGVLGTLTIKPKTVTVELNRIDRIRVYYGNTFSYPAGVDNYVNYDTIELAYNERLEVAVDFLIDGKVGTPKYVDFYQRYAYSARLNDSGCVVYESDGETQIANGADNYNFICEDIENLHISSRTVRIRLNDISGVPYGDEVSYPDGPNNFKSIENLDDDGFEGLPYGEKFEVKVIYRKDGKDIYKPVDVGTYSIHAMTYLTVVYESDGVTEVNDGTYDGTYNYVIIINDGTLEIVPRKISIQLSSFEIEYGEFGNTFEYPSGEGNYDIDNSDELVYGQTLEVGFIREFIYKQLIDGEYKVVDPKDVGTYQITFKEGDYSVFDAEETYYAGSYDITFIPGTLTITRKEIIVKVDDKTCTYGDELPENTYKIYDSEYNEYVLPYDDELAVTEYEYYIVRDDGRVVFVTPRNAGKYSIAGKNETITNDGANVSSNYRFGQHTAGTLTINKADLKLQLIDVEDAVYGDYRAYPSGIGNFDAEKTVGIKYDDQLELAVEYEVYSAANLTGLVTVGDKSTEIPTNAAWYYINLVAKDSVIHTADGEQFDLELNYNVVCEHDEFYIFTRSVRVSYTSSEYTYGETVEKPVFTIEVVRANLDQSEISTTELPYGEICDFDIEYEDADGIPVNAGYHYFRIAKRYVNGREDLAGNYSFRRENLDSYVKITKKQIEITLYGMTATYGDFEVTQPATHTFTPTAGVLEYTDELTVHIKFTEVGGESAAVFITPKNVGLYSVVATQFTATYFDGYEETAAGDKLKNYEIVCSHGTLEITKKQLHIALSKEVEIVYGEAVPEYGDIPFTVTSDGEIITALPYDDPLGVSCYYEGAGVPVNAGTYAIVFDGAAINLGEGDYNYDISGEDGLLSIKLKEIEVTIKGGTAVYGYENLPEIEYEITDGEMVGGEKLVPAYTFSLNGEPCVPVNVGVYDITVNVEACSVVGGNALYENYKVNYVIDGNLEITASPLTVKIIGDSFTYGERTANATYAITAGELFHGDRLELTYKYNNETVEPTAAGTYALTATAEIVGGNASVDNYDITFADNSPELIINKREIAITLNQGGVTTFTYGDNYGEEICSAQIINAVGGQTITVAVTYTKKEASALRMLRARALTLRAAETLTPKDAGTYIAVLDFDNCVVTDADGNSVDGGIDNYELSVDCAAVEFVIAPMALTVKVENAQITYGDKLPSMLDYGVEEKMPYGESLNLAFSFAGEDGKLPVHKGDYPVAITNAQISGGKIANYELYYTNEAPTLTIEAKPLNIQLGNLSVSYGAQVNYEVKVGNYQAADGLLSSDKLTVTQVIYRCADGTEYGSANPPANVGTYAIVYVNCTIVNADGENAKGDYIIADMDGVLVIDSSLITVYTASAEKVYDGTALSTDKYDRYDGDLGGYRLVVDTDNICEQIDATAGDGVDNTTKFKIVDESGNETQNLKLKYGTPGKLKVTRKNAEITICDTSAVYGEHPEIKHVATGLADGEDVEFEVEFDVAPVTNGGFFILPVGNYLMNYAANSASIVGGRGKVSNYELVFKPDAALEVTQRHIAITTASGSAEYNGSAFSKPDGYKTEWVVNGERQNLTGLINGDTLTVANAASIMGYGSRDNDCTYTVSENYVIEEAMYAYGTLTVTRRKVTAKTADVNEIYNGEAHSSGVVTDVDNKLAEGHEFRVTSELVSRVNVCSNVNNVLKVIIVDTNDGDKDVTSNYAIKYSYGTITVTKRPLEITTGGVTVESYDGTAHGNDEYEKADGLLTALGHELVADEVFTYTNATEGEDNKTTYKVYCGGEDVTDNYKIEYEYGKIVIGKKSVTVTLNSGVEIQYGNDYTAALTDGAATLISGETIELAITVEGEVNGVGTYYASVDWANSVVSNAEGEIEGGANNYAPEFVPASRQFKIIPREIEVTLNAGGQTQFTYGDDYDTAIRTVTVDSMVGGETLNVAVIYNVTAPRYVGHYSAELDLSGCTVTGGDIADYDIVLCDDVEFDIVAREITVDMEDMTVNYGETPAYPDGVTGYGVRGLVDGDTVTVTPAFRKNGEQVIPDFAGEYEIVCGGIEVNGGAVAAENYTVKTGKSGTLTITGIVIEIERKTVKKTYDGTPLTLSPEAPETEVGYVIKGDERLRDGYRLVLDGTFATADGNVSSSCANTAEYKVLNADGNEAGEYVITYKPDNSAMLVIEQRVIKVKTATPAARDYDGTPLKAEGCTITEGALVSGHELKTSDHATLTDAGSIDNTMVITVTAGAEVVTANYDVQVTCGTLTVNKLAVEVNIESISKVYGEDTGVDKIYNHALVNGEVLGYGLKYFKDGAACGNGLLSVGSYDIVADEDAMTVNGGKLGNYEITFDTDATLTITERHITVTVADRDVEEDKKAYTKAHLGIKTADGGEGFVGSDFEEVTANFSYADKLPEPDNENVLEYKTVSVTLSGDVMNNYICEYIDGTLTVTKRKVLVAPEYNGTAPYVYNGKEVEISKFGYTDKHIVDGAAADEAGFNGETFTATYTFKDSSGATVDAMKDAGTYTVSVTLSGDGIKNYCVEYEDLTFTIEQCPLSYKVEGEYVYSNSLPALTAECVGFADGENPDLDFELFDGDEIVTRYNVGTYQVKIKFEGMNNYSISATVAEITIIRRTIVVIPVDPYDGKAQKYTGENLKLGATDREIASGSLENGTLASGDELTIESSEIKPTALRGTLKITKVYITDGEDDVSPNYNVIYTYNRANATIQSLKLESRHFNISAAYEVREIKYALDNVGTEIPYDGKTHNYEFGGISKLIVSEEGQKMIEDFGLELRVPDSVTVPAAADDYKELITALVYVYDGENNRLAVFTAVCTNADDNVIRVTKNVVSVDLSDLTKETIESVSDREVTFNNTASACSAEVRAYNLDGEWLIGITLFSESASGKRTDLSANYLLNESCTLDFAEVKIITLAQAAEYERPEIKVEINVAADEIGGLCTYDGESRWVLPASEYTVTGGLQTGHELQVLVFIENGEYLLGVTIYGEAGGRRNEAGGNYRVIVKSDVNARYVAMSEISTLKRELRVDFSGAVIGEDGTVTGYEVKGLNNTDSHVIEVTATANGDGTYTANVAVYQLRKQGTTYKKANMAERYELKYTLSDSITAANSVTGTLN